MTLAELPVVLAAPPARRLWLPFLLPSFNDLEHARGRIRNGARGRKWNGYAQIKARHQSAVVMLADAVAVPLVVLLDPATDDQHARPVDRRQPVASGGRKILHDALARGRGGVRGWAGAGVIHCDGAHCVAGQVDLYDVELAPGVEVLLYEVPR